MGAAILVNTIPIEPYLKNPKTFFVGYPRIRKGAGNRHRQKVGFGFLGMLAGGFQARFVHKGADAYVLLCHWVRLLFSALLAHFSAFLLLFSGLGFRV